MLIEKSFLHLFISDRKIYIQYKKHLFCQIDIIDCTAGTLIKMFPTEQMFNQAKKKAFFGHFMRILKIYSGIQTLDEDIVSAIKAKTQLWNKITKHLIVPYQNIYEQKLGSFQNVTQPIVQQFKIAKTSDISSKPKQNNVVLKQIEEEQSVPKMKGQINSLQKEDQLKNSKNQIFNKTSINTNFISNIQQQNQNLAKQRPNHYLSQSNIVDYGSNDKQLKKSESFKQFMHKKKVQAQHELKAKRSLSQQRRLSGQKAKIISNSPSKKNSWRQDTNQQKQKKQEKKQNMPKVPVNRKNVFNMSSVSQRKSPVRKQDLDQRVNKSMINMNDLKKLKVFQIDKPKDKKYRKIEDKDKLLLQFLGLPA